jgi:hypothetical protein
MKHHFFRESDRSICERINSVFGRNKCVRCAFLREEENRFFKCSAFGFRKVTSGTKGVCIPDGWYNLYDQDMLTNKQDNKYNFCKFRIIAPVISIISLVGVGAAVNLIIKVIT